jgi:hypothetical protein
MQAATGPEISWARKVPIVRIPGAPGADLQLKNPSYLLVAFSGLGVALPTPAGVLLLFAGATTQAPIPR